MKWIDKWRISTLAAWAIITVSLAVVMASPYLPHTTLYAQAVGPGGVPGAGGGGGAVSSVFGRTGAVVAATGDYTAAQVTNAAATNAANTFTASQTITGVSAGLTLFSTGGDSWSLSGGGTGFGGTSVYLYNSTAGVISQAWTGTSTALEYNGVWGWTDTTSPTVAPDTGLSRISAKVVAVGGGTNGDNSGTIEVANLTLGGAPIEQAATAPTGSCSALEWVLLNDGHLSYCSGASGTWAQKF